MEDKKPDKAPERPLRNGETTQRRGKARLGEPHRPIQHIGTGG